MSSHVIALKDACDSAGLVMETVWAGYEKPITLSCANGHIFETTPHNFYRTKKCPQCIKHGSSRIKREIIAKQNGYRLDRSRGPLQSWIYTCQSCGNAKSHHPNYFKNFHACRSCGDMENHTIWVALDKEPYCNAIVFIGRIPEFLKVTDQYGDPMVDIEPVFADVTTFRPGHFFYDPDSCGAFEPIVHTDVEGITWEPTGELALTDHQMRLLTTKNRRDKATLLSHAIDFVAGRIPDTRYAGDDGFFVLNTEHNSEFKGWNKGKPVYQFEPEQSPLWKALVE